MILLFPIGHFPCYFSPYALLETDESSFFTTILHIGLLTDAIEIQAKSHNLITQRNVDIF